MKPGPEADPLYLAKILEIMQLIRESLAEIAESDFLEDRDKADATALRLSAIGEFSRKLSDEMRSRYPQIAWLRMYSLRNIVAHNYDKLDHRIIWRVATTALDELHDACRAELNRIDE
ncbi:MAG: HepT-like ribonuclease domain-containing protein [Allosphingosinicella sp.]